MFMYQLLRFWGHLYIHTYYKYDIKKQSTKNKDKCKKRKGKTILASAFFLHKNVMKHDINIYFFFVRDRKIGDNHITPFLRKREIH